MFKNKFYSRKTILLLIDFALLFISLYLALKIRSLWAADSSFYSFNQHFRPFLVLFLFWLVAFYLFDIYDLKKIRSLAFTIYSIAGALATTLILSVIFFYLVPFFITPKTVLFLTGAIAFFFLFFWRYLWNQLFKTWNFKRKIAVVGADSAKIKVLPEILSAGETDCELAGIVRVNNEDSLAPNYPILGNYQNLPQIISQYKIDELITAFDYRSHHEAAREVAECLSSGVQITELPIFYERATGKVPIECIDQIWFLYNLGEINQKFLEMAERAVDILLSTLGLILSLPFLPFIALAIKINSAGPIFYSQKRVGKNGRIFKTYKFRTMIRDAEGRTGPTWAGAYDPRVTRVGKFLRKIRLDEIPQLWNVLCGEMSLVGPRPERPEFVEKLKTEIPFYNRRLMVKPGLTGWAQIMYKYSASREETMEKLQYDLYYIKNRSLLLYFIILIRTIRIVLTRQGI